MPDPLQWPEAKMPDAAMSAWKSDVLPLNNARLANLLVRIADAMWFVREYISGIDADLIMSGSEWVKCVSDGPKAVGKPYSIQQVTNYF